jgi:hypothetical protein
MSSGSSHKALELARWLAEEKFSFLSNKSEAGRAAKQPKPQTHQTPRKAAAKKR